MENNTLIWMVEDVFSQSKSLYYRIVLDKVKKLIAQQYDPAAKEWVQISLVEGIKEFVAETPVTVIQTNMMAGWGAK